MDYSDMIHLPRPRAVNRVPMPLYERAAQFAPFAALSGFDDRIGEESRLTETRPQLCDEDARLINDNLILLRDSKQPLPVRLTLFVPDASKAGGASVELEGVVRRVDTAARELILTDKKVLKIDNILALAIL